MAAFQAAFQAYRALRIGDRIVWFSDDGPEFGIVKWIGILNISEDRMVGVEFDNAVGTGTGKFEDRQLFCAKQDHASLIPIMGLVKEDDFLGTNTFPGSCLRRLPRSGRPC
jgi:dynactin complex subunit